MLTSVRREIESSLHVLKRFFLFRLFGVGVCVFCELDRCAEMLDDLALPSVVHRIVWLSAVSSIGVVDYLGEHLDRIDAAHSTDSDKL